MKNSFYLYRYFNNLGQLLYVGQSNNVLRRNGDHSSSSSWFDEAEMITIQRCKNKSQLNYREILAIKNEKPIYNIAHNDGFKLDSYGNRILPMSTETFFCHNCKDAELCSSCTKQCARKKV